MQNVMEVESLDMTAFEELARRAMYVEDFGAAFKLLAREQEELANNLDLVPLLLECAVRAGSLSEVAMTWLRSIGEGQPRLLADMLKICVDLRNEDKPELAAELAAMATDLDSFHAPAWHERALCAKALGEEKWVFYYCQRALAADPDYSVANTGIHQLKSETIPAEMLSLRFDEAVKAVADGNRHRATQILDQTVRMAGIKELTNSLIGLIEGFSEPKETN